MFKASSDIHRIKSTSLLGLIVLLASVNLWAQLPDVVAVNIFGDGDPENGVEDSREQIMGGRDSSLGLADRKLNAGTIECDGIIRGSAMVLDTRVFAPDLKGVVLASAAHVLFDLDKNQRFKRCEFHFLGLGGLHRYRAKIDMDTLSLGSFSPTQVTSGMEFGEGDWAFLYVPRPWKNFDPDEAMLVRDFSLLPIQHFQRTGGEIRLIAFDASKGVMSISRNCTVIESTNEDLGGGSWKGQLLDDCDSGGGASGGGIVAVDHHQQYLIGIRGGSHWSEQAFPAATFPLGPPDGSVWSRESNTNFGRAIDSNILNDLVRFAQAIENKSNVL